MVLDKSYNLVLQPTQLVEVNTERLEDLSKSAILGHFIDLEDGLRRRSAWDIRAPVDVIAVEVARE